jgi:hypothetical protein
MKTRWLWSLPAAGLLYVVGVVSRGEFANPANAADFAARAGRAVFPLSYLLILLASALMLIGYVALGERLRAPAATVLSIIGLHFLAAFFGVMAITYPAFAHAGAVALAAQAMNSPATLVVLAMVGLNVLGHVLFGIAMWRTTFIPKAAIAPFVLAPVLQLIPFIYPLEILGCALALVSGALIALAKDPSPA